MITIVLILIVIGIVLYVVNAVVPMDSKIKLILNAVVVIAVLLWLANAFGLIDGRYLRLR